MNSRTRSTIQLLAATALVAAAAACTDTPLITEPSIQPSAVKLNENNGMQVLDIAFTDSWTCSGPFEVRILGSIKVASVQVKKDGSVRIVEVAPNTRITVSTTTSTLRGAIGGTAFYDIDPNGDLVSITFPGLNAAFTVPGTGLVLLETGLLVLAPDGTVIRQSGPHQMFGSNPETAKFCAALGL